MSRCRLRPLQDRGAVLVHVGIALVILLGFSAIVLDYGIMWVSRRQAQNAADAGALAGAVSLAFEDYANRTPAGPAVTKAVATGNQNYVWGQAAGITPPDVTFPPCPDGTDSCVRADVYRNQARGNALPVFFARLFGVTQQGVKATATAQAASANAVRCVKPWAIPDRWEERFNPPMNFDTSQFDLYDASGNLLTTGPGPGTADYYCPSFYDPTVAAGPTDGYGASCTPTGYKPRDAAGNLNDWGLQVSLKTGNPADAPMPSYFYAIDLPPDFGTGGDVYRENIANCNPNPFPIGGPSMNQVEPGNMQGPTRQGVDDLVAQDPNRNWSMSCMPDAAGGCPAGCDNCSSRGGVYCSGSCAPGSPRVVPIPLYDPYWYAVNGHSGRIDIRITNIMGFFVEGMCGNDVCGRYVGIVGEIWGPPINNTNPWLKVIRLVR